jgi:2-keto-4-pentenoate hydratase
VSAARASIGPLPAGEAAATLAFVLGATISGETIWDVLAATKAICPALTAGDHHMIGSPVPVPAVDLRLLGVVLEHNGEVVATAAGAASEGHPAAAVAALAKKLATTDTPLKAGDIVVTAPLALTTQTHDGDVLVASIGRVGTVEAAVGPSS